MDERQAAPRISVTARDPERLRSLLRAQPYSGVAKAVDVSKAYIGELAMGRRVRVSMRVATALEHALGLPAGELFHIPAAEAAQAQPYLR